MNIKNIVLYSLILISILILNFNLTNVPLVADDFISFFTFLNFSYPSNTNDLINFFQPNGNKYVPLGNLFSLILNKFYFTSSAFFGINIKFVIIVFKNLLLLSYQILFILAFKSIYPSSKNYFIYGSAWYLLFSGLMQIHTFWSNDPVTSYLITGQVSTIICLTSILCFLIFLKRLQKVYLVLCYIFVIAAILVYPSNIGLLLGLFVIMLLIRIGIYLTMPFAASFIFFLYLNFTSPERKDYSGTVTNLDNFDPSFYLTSLFSNFPLFAWKLNIISTGGLLRTESSLLLFIVFSLSLSILISLFILNHKPFVLYDLRPFKIFISLIFIWALIWFVIERTTIKYSSLDVLGQVYLSYLPLHIFITSIIFYALILFSKKFILFPLMMLVLIIPIQFGLNQEHTRQLNQYFEYNNYLLNFTVSSFSNPTYDANVCTIFNSEEMNNNLMYDESYKNDLISKLDQKSKTLNKNC